MRGLFSEIVSNSSRRDIDAELLRDRDDMQDRIGRAAKGISTLIAFSKASRFANRPRQDITPNEIADLFARFLSDTVLLG